MKEGKPWLFVVGVVVLFAGVVDGSLGGGADLVAVGRVLALCALAFECK